MAVPLLAAGRIGGQGVERDGLRPALVDGDAVRLPGQEGAHQVESLAGGMDGEGHRRLDRERAGEQARRGIGGGGREVDGDIAARRRVGAQRAHRQDMAEIHARPPGDGQAQRTGDAAGPAGQRELRGGELEASAIRN